MAYTGKKPVDVVDVTESQSLTVSDDLTVDTNTLYVDSTNNNVGIGTSSPATALDVNGTINVRTSGYQFGRITTNNVDTNNGGLTFQTISGGSFSERMRIQSGGGISFNGDTAAANALDDYEEGTWTPTVDYGTITVHYASYVKIGKLVSLKAYISNFSDRTTASAITIRNLPFVAASGRQTYGVAMHRFVLGGTDQIGTYSGGGTSILYLYGCGSNLNYDLKNHSDLSGVSSLFFINHVYETT